MSFAGLLLLGAQAAHVGSGAALTLVLPLALLLVALAVWFVAFRRATKR
jgi:hypothetical protein